jgi:hypothetical protein
MWATTHRTFFSVYLSEMTSKAKLSYLLQQKVVVEKQEADTRIFARSHEICLRSASTIFDSTICFLAYFVHRKFTYWICHKINLLSQKFLEHILKKYALLKSFCLSMRPSIYFCHFWTYMIFKFWILLEDYMSDILPRSSGVEVGLGPTNIKIF